MSGNSGAILTSFQRTSLDFEVRDFGPAEPAFVTRLYRFTSVMHVTAERDALRVTTERDGVMMYDIYERMALRADRSDGM